MLKIGQVYFQVIGYLNEWADNLVENIWKDKGKKKKYNQWQAQRYFERAKLEPSKPRKVNLLRKAIKLNRLEEKFYAELGFVYKQSDFSSYPDVSEELKNAFFYHSHEKGFYNFILGMYFCFDTPEIDEGLIHFLISLIESPNNSLYRFFAAQACVHGKRYDSAATQYAKVYYSRRDEELRELAYQKILELRKEGHLKRPIQDEELELKQFNLSIEGLSQKRPFEMN